MNWLTAMTNELRGEGDPTPVELERAALTAALARGDITAAQVQAQALEKAHDTEGVSGRLLRQVENTSQEVKEDIQDLADPLEWLKAAWQNFLNAIGME